MEDQQEVFNIEDQDESPKIFDVLEQGKKIGEFFDINPIEIDDDETCELYLLRIKNELPLKEKDVELIDRCLSAVLAKVDDDISFGPEEIVLLGTLAMSYPSHAHEILACSLHITESLDCEIDVPPGLFASLALAHGALGDVYAKGLAIGDISKYEEFEDDITDSEEESE